MCGGFFATIESYLNKEQVEFVRKAYDVAAEAHASQRRKSGEPYIIHPLGVATILSQLQLDELTLAAAFCMMWWKILISAWIP